MLSAAEVGRTRCARVGGALRTCTAEGDAASAAAGDDLLGRPRRRSTLAAPAACSNRHDLCVYRVVLECTGARYGAVRWPAGACRHTGVHRPNLPLINSRDLGVFLVTAIPDQILRGHEVV